jgi:hypothetical protein
MRAHSMPALADIPETASLTDVVFRRAQAEPDAVMLRRRTTDSRYGRPAAWRPWHPAARTLTRSGWSSAGPSGRPGAWRRSSIPRAPPAGLRAAL